MKGESMKIVIHNLYGRNDQSVAYMRKLGYCFDFVSLPTYATEMTAEECKDIMEHSEYYLDQYKASHMTIE
jgi:hypothetical protein